MRSSFCAEDHRVARVLSAAPASAHLDANRARELLRENGGIVRYALDAVRAEVSSIDGTVVHPLVRVRECRNLQNAGNSCYLGAVLAACFAEWDAWDALIEHVADAPPKIAALRDALRGVVRSMRCGEVAAAANVQKVRNALIALGFYDGKRQEDASELFAFLVDRLGAPLLPFDDNLLHSATRDEADSRLSTERILWLSFPSEKPTLRKMLNSYFLGDKREGLRRALPDRMALVDAWCARFLLPEYTPATNGPAHTVHSFEFLALPLAIKRYSSTMSKERRGVDIPAIIDFTNYISPRASADAYTLVLRSVVCHLGSSPRSGHYIAYTLDREREQWRRWDDLDTTAVQVSRATGTSRGPADRKWREELRLDSYLVFYELVPGDGRTDPRAVLDAYSSGEFKRSNSTEQDAFLAAVLQNMEIEMENEIDDKSLALVLQKMEEER